MKIYYHLSIAEYELIKSSRGNGPMKLRQPLNLFKRWLFLKEIKQHNFRGSHHIGWQHKII